MRRVAFGAMQVWTGVMISGAALLVIAGVPKLRRPGPTITALRSVGAVRVGPATVRGLAAAEVTAGLLAIVAGGRWADGAVTLLYLGFTGFLLRALQTPTASCGCTASEDTPPSIGHLAMTSVFAAAGVAALIAGGRTGLIQVTSDTGAADLVAVVGFAAITTWLAWSILTLSTPLPAARRT